MNICRRDEICFMDVKQTTDDPFNIMLWFIPGRGVIAQIQGNPAGDGDS